MRIITGEQTMTVATDFMILQADPRSQYLAYQAQIDEAIQRVLFSGQYILGKEVASFESELASFLGVRNAIGVGSGTAALEIALRACDIGIGDEVITSAHTAVATVAAIESVGARPVLVDIESDSFLIDAAKIEEVVTKKTKAIIPVHLYGQPADLSEIKEIAGKFKLLLIEDCAQAIGASYAGKRVGTWGDLGIFSFYPTKNLGAIGDGGMVVTHKDQLAAKIRSLRQYGWRTRYISDFAGTNSRLDELQAAILRVKLTHLDRDNLRRAAIANRYSEALNSVVVVPRAKPCRTHVFHLYVVRTQRRDGLQKFLHERGIGSAVHYPTPVHLQPAYLGKLGSRGSYPVTESVTQEILSLPLYAELSDGQCNDVITILRAFAAAANG
jgi:dTDP-4-amino-4,6-dideoxygalactose transaminase